MGRQLKVPRLTATGATLVDDEGNCAGTQAWSNGGSRSRSSGRGRGQRAQHIPCDFRFGVFVCVFSGAVCDVIGCKNAAINQSDNYVGDCVLLATCHVPLATCHLPHLPAAAVQLLQAPLFFLCDFDFYFDFSLGP